MPSSGAHGRFSGVFGGAQPVCTAECGAGPAEGAATETATGLKRRSGGWSFTHRARSAPGRRGVKAGLKAEADPQIGKTNWLRKENRIYVWAGTSTSRRATV